MARTFCGFEREVPAIVAGGPLEYPHYARPEVFRGMRVPDIFLSGDHAKIAQWHREQALERTKQW